MLVLRPRHWKTNRDSYAFRDEQGEPLRAVVSALRAARWRTVEARSGMSPAVVRADTRAIGGTRRGPTRRERARQRPPVQSLCPLDAWRTLRDDPWRRYRHHVTTTKERVRLGGGLVVAEEPKDDISAACLEVALAVVLSKELFRFLEELEITGWDAANPSAFPVLDLDELRRHAHRGHADDDVETSPVADDCSDFEHGRMRTHRVHNRTIGNLTVRADPSVRTAAIDESGWPLSELDAGRAAPALASLERAVAREEERRRAPLSPRAPRTAGEL
jgi:hypothetical protein